MSMSPTFDLASLGEKIQKMQAQIDKKEKVDGATMFGEVVEMFRDVHKILADQERGKSDLVNQAAIMGAAMS